MRAYLKLIGSFVVVCAVCVCIPGRLFAQGFGSINGTVTDTSGAVVPGAEVTATQAATGITSETTSGSEGNFVFPILAPSVYNISATRQGFQAYTQKGVQLRADNAVTVNITLKPGTTTETVTVKRRDSPGRPDDRHAAAGDRHGVGQRAAPERAQRRRPH